MAKSSTRTDSASSRARVAFCITELEPGGAERALVELVTRLDRTRFEPVVYCLGRRPASNPISLADRLEASGIAVFCFDAEGPRDLPRVARRLVEQMRRDAPALVQTFLFHANVLGAWAARRAGTPRVATGIRVAERYSRWHLWLARWADRHVDRHVCVSGGVREFSRHEGRLPAEKLLVIPNAIDVEKYARATPISRHELGVGENAKLIACVGRLERQKGVDWLLEVMRGVEAQTPSSHLLLIGDGPQRGALQRQARRLGLTRVHFLGFRRDVPEIFAACDLVALPSRWEGMPNVVLEAMAAGRAVIGTDVEGVRELLAPNDAEQVSPRHAPEKFGAQILKLLRDDELRNRLGLLNQERAQAVFTPAATVAAYERLYCELLS